MRQRKVKYKHRIRLLRELYQSVLNKAESFERDNLGADLCYLIGAVLDDSFCDWEADGPLVRLLRKNFSRRHAVWDYIHVESTDRETKGDQTVDARQIATMRAALRLWQRHSHNRNFDDMASDSGNLQPLTDQEIDLLCERLNGGGDVIIAADSG